MIVGLSAPRRASSWAWVLLLLWMSPCLAAAPDERSAAPQIPATPATHILLWLDPSIEFYDFHSGKRITGYSAPSRLRSTIRQAFTDELSRLGYQLMPEPPDPGWRSDPEARFKALRRQEPQALEHLRAQLQNRHQIALVARIKFFLDATARDPQAIQAISPILFGKLPTRRMVLDARAYQGPTLKAIWQNLAQERLAPEEIEDRLKPVAASLMRGLTATVEDME